MASLISQFVGHGTQKNWLLERAAKKELPSSIIFQGPQGVGKKTLAQALLQVLNCKQSELSCGQCSNCKRSLEEKNELIHFIEPEDKKSIGVDQIRELHKILSLRTMHEARMVIIDPADKLTNQSANALLKVLEEAPEKTYFILITEQIRSLLPTIRSRSHMLKFSTLSPSELAQFQAFDEVSLTWSGGRLQMAMDLQEKEHVDQLNDSLQFLYSLICEMPQDWKKKAPWFFANNERAREFNFNIWNQALEKRLYKADVDLNWLPEDSARISFIHEKIEFLKKDILANVDKLLAIENFYYQLKPAKLT